MELYIITIDEVFDFEGFQHKPLVFLTENGARAEFDRLVREARKEYPDFTVDKGKRSVSIYEDQSWSKSHFDVKIDVVDVRDIVPLERKGLSVVFGETASKVAMEKGIKSARRALSKGTLEGASDTYRFSTEKDRRTAIRMLNDADGWMGAYWEAVD